MPDSEVTKATLIFASARVQREERHAAASSAQRADLDSEFQHVTLSLFQTPLRDDFSRVALAHIASGRAWPPP